MDIFAKIREGHDRQLSLGIYDDALVHWNKNHAVLGEFSSVTDLIELCRGSAEGRYEERDRVVAALCMLAAKDEAAKTLLLGLFLPGLIDLANTCAKRRVVSADELHAELLANFWTAVCGVDENTTKVAARLLNGARWRTARALGRAVSWSRREHQVSDVELLYLDERGSREEPQDGTVGDWEDVLERAVNEGVIGKVDAELVVASWGTLRDVSSRYEIALGQARRRRQLAKVRIRDWVEGTATAPECERTIEPRATPRPPDTAEPRTVRGATSRE